MNTTQILTIASAFSPLAVVAFLMWKEARTGSKGLSAEVISNYDKLDKQQKEVIAEKEKIVIAKEKDITELKGAVRKANEECIQKTSKLEGVINGKDEIIQRQQLTIENKNPELIKILNQNLAINERVASFMERLDNRMEKTEQATNEQTGILKEGKERNKRIDEATEKEKGHVLRK